METPKSAGHWSWIIAALVASVFLTAIFWMGWRFSNIPAERYLTLVVLIAAGALGWILGVILSPDSKTEARNFSSFGKSVSLFVSGYLVSKIDVLVTALFDPQILLNATDHLAAYRLVGALATLALVTMLTYNVRVYGLTVGE